MNTTTITIYEYISELNSILFTAEKDMFDATNEDNTTKYETALNTWIETSELRLKAMAV